MSEIGLRELRARASEVLRQVKEHGQRYAGRRSGATSAKAHPAPSPAGSYPQSQPHFLSSASVRYKASQSCSGSSAYKAPRPATMARITSKPATGIRQPPRLMSPSLRAIFMGSE